MDLDDYEDQAAEQLAALPVWEPWSGADYPGDRADQADYEPADKTGRLDEDEQGEPQQ